MIEELHSNSINLDTILGLRDEKIQNIISHYELCISH